MTDENALKTEINELNAENERIQPMIDNLQSIADVHKKLSDWIFRNNNRIHMLKEDIYDEQFSAYIMKCKKEEGFVASGMAHNMAYAASKQPEFNRIWAKRNTKRLP